MRIRISAIGRVTRGPEADLIATYQKRFDQTGRHIGLGPLDIIAAEAKRAERVSEAETLSKSIPSGAIVVAMDERGKTLASPEFARLLGDWRDQGRSSVCFLIGGADGIHKDLRTSADYKLSFGKMVWPHLLARAMLCEQLYRASSILSGGPYHRE